MKLVVEHISISTMIMCTNKYVYIYMYVNENMYIYIYTVPFKFPFHRNFAGFQCHPKIGSIVAGSRGENIHVVYLDPK